MAGYHCPMPTAFLSLQLYTQFFVFLVAKYTIYHYFTLQFIPNSSAFFPKKGETILDLTYSALKVHQNTGRGEVKRNPCLECANRLVPKTRQNLCHPAGVLLTVS